MVYTKIIKYLKKIIIDRKINLWPSIMKLIFEFLNIKHKRIILYHSRTNDAIKRFNDVLNHMFTKYCIDESIKNWNFYLNQILFVIKIQTHSIINFFLFVVWNQFLFFRRSSRIFYKFIRRTYRFRIVFISR